MGDQIPNGLRIRGVLEHEVSGLREESKTKEELYKNTINLWLWKDPELHLFELQNVLAENKRRRITSNPTGMNKTKTFGAGISIPTGLYIALEKVEPELFNNKKMLNFFKKKFPQFKVY
jgi:hypothetical protein